MIDKFFYENPVFRLLDFQNWKDPQGSSNKINVHSALRYYQKTGRIIGLKKELYAVVPPNESPETVLVDSYLIAAKASDDSVLAFHTALELHGFAYSSFEQFTFMSKHKIRPFEYAGQNFLPTTFPKGDSSSEEIETINRQGLDIKITSLERTFVDVLNRIEISGGWEEVIRSLESIGPINIDRVINYCLSLGVNTLNAKVGFFLEQRPGVFSPSEEQLGRLLSERPLHHRSIRGVKGETLKFIKKWNISLPESVINKTWEEPNDNF